MNIESVIVITIVIFVFGMFSQKLQKTILTPPMIFTAFGTLIGAQGLGILDLGMADSIVHLLAEITLILVLFGDAARIDLRALRKEMGLPIRLLSIGMPLTILLGGFFAFVFLDKFTFWEAILIGAILAPTDAALGQAVVSSNLVPIRIRQALNVESGLNDGIALPIVMILLSFAGMMESETRDLSAWLVFVFLQITLGPLIGVIVGWLGARFLTLGTEKGWISGSFQKILGLSLAFLAFAGAEGLGGNGFIAAFVAGMTLGHFTKGHCEEVYEFLEAEGQLLMLMVFMLLGVTLALPALESASIWVFLYAALSLTIVRIVPVFISLLGTGLRLPSKAFLGWFGPRGLASILFGILVLEEGHLLHGEFLLTVVVVTVLFSIYAHGITAVPGANWYGNLVKQNPKKCVDEMKEVTAHRLRVSTKEELGK